MISGEKSRENRILEECRINFYHELLIPQQFYIFEKNILYFLKNDCTFFPKYVFVSLKFWSQYGKIQQHINLVGIYVYAC